MEPQACLVDGGQDILGWKAVSWILSGLSPRCLGASGSKSREQLEMWGLPKRSHRIAGAVLANIPKLGRGHPRILTWVRNPTKSVLSYRGTSKDAAPFFLLWDPRFWAWQRDQLPSWGSVLFWDIVAIPLPQSPAATKALQPASSSPSFCFVEGPSLTSISLPDPPTQGILY